jgi:uncharacterized protein YbjT (DUF2867 family)
VTNPGPILVTGGTGTTGRVLARLLRDRGAVVRTASRHPSPVDEPSTHVPFDWTDPATFGAALAGVERVYLVPPGRVPMTMVEPFLAAAQRTGVRRAVLLSVSTTISGGARDLDRVHHAVRETCGEWAILRPTWFMQNFVGSGLFAAGIRERGEITTATGTGRIGFVDARDVAAVAAQVLLGAGAPNAELSLTGPETLNYDDVAAMIAEVSGRSVRHHRLSSTECLDNALALGLPAAMADAVVEMDTMISNGAEDKVTSVVEAFTGRPPRSFRTFAIDHRAAWHSDAAAPAS